MDPSNTTLDLVLLAVIAVVGWRLWRVLGTHSGIDDNPRPTAQIEPVTPALPPREDLSPVWQDHAKEGSELAKTLIEMAKIDPALSPSNFLEGAKIVHAKVLEAFAATKLNEVEQLLGHDVLQALRAEIAARLKKGETLHYKLVGYDSVRILSAKLKGNIAALTTRFETRLISWTSDAAGKVTIGNATKTESHVDLWTFEKDLTSSDPSWLLVETGEAKEEG